MYHGIGEKFPNLQKLIIPEEISNFEIRHFSDLTNLKELDITSLRSKFIADNIFHHLTNLQVLSYFGGNELTNIGQSLPNLKKLSVDRIRSDKLDKTVLSKIFNAEMTHLKEIYLYGVSLSFNEISDYSFEDLTTLEVLDFSYCETRLVHEKAFWKLRNLKKLTILENPIKDAGLPEKVFQDLIELEYLSLAICEITFFHENLFANLRKLVELNLNYNQVKIIPPKTFFNLGNLKILDLGYCGLESLAADLFKNNLKLERIQLESNRFKSVDVDFRLLTNIEEIVFEGDCFRGYLGEKIDYWKQPRYSTTQQLHESIKEKCAQ